MAPPKLWAALTDGQTRCTRTDGPLREGRPRARILLSDMLGGNGKGKAESKFGVPTAGKNVLSAPDREWSSLQIHIVGQESRRCGPGTRLNTLRGHT